MNPHLVELSITWLVLALLLGLTAAAIAVLPWSMDALRESQSAWACVGLLPGALMRSGQARRPGELLLASTSVDDLLPAWIPREHPRKPCVSRSRVHERTSRRPTLA
jgi:hypothetical protein